MAAIDFDFLKDDGLEFETHPELFVLLDREPIVWTIRGIRHFAPRFRRVGIDVAQVKTPRQFRSALRRWDSVEWRILVQNIEARAVEGSLAHECLQAILTDHPNTQALIARFEAASQQAESASARNGRAPSSAT